MTGQNLINQFARAKRRLLLLDYDGTLVDLAPTPPQAAPTTALKSLLKRLTVNSKNKVVIISGRDPKILETWLGGLGLDFAAEHGFFIKRAQHEWQAIAGDIGAWKQQVKQHFNQAVKQLPDSFVEEKSASIVWHYRRADQTKASHTSSELLKKLQSLPDGLRVVPGSKIVEVKLAAATKENAAGHWLKQARYDFVLAAGDDTTDEDMFRAVGNNGFTIKVGSGFSLARQTLASPKAMFALLSKLQNL